MGMVMLSWSLGRYLNIARSSGLASICYITKRIRKVGTVCEYFRRSAEVVNSRMRVVFPHWQATDAHRRKADRVCVLFCAFKMFKIIERPIDSEIGLLPVF
jgi:hypothetical protein